MKCRLPIMFFTFALAMCAVPRAGAEVDWTDRSDVSVAIGFLTFKNGGFDDGGPAIGLEARTPIAPRWLVGGSITAGTNIGFFTDDLSLTSLEANAARVLPISPRLAASIGGGLAAVRGKYVDEYWFDDDVETSGWAFGGQVGAGLDVYPGRIVVGLKVVRQITGKVEDLGWSLDHWRFVLRTGYSF